MNKQQKAFYDFCKKYAKTTPYGSISVLDGISYFGHYHIALRARNLFETSLSLKEAAPYLPDKLLTVFDELVGPSVNLDKVAFTNMVLPLTKTKAKSLKFSFEGQIVEITENGNDAPEFGGATYIEAFENKEIFTCLLNLKDLKNILTMFKAFGDRLVITKGERLIKLSVDDVDALLTESGRR